jgi:hypothetical protein
MAQQKKQVTLVDLDFDNLKTLNDRAIYQRFRAACSLSKKSLVPRNLKTNAYRVSRGEKHITLHFIWATSKDDPGTEVFRFSFAPGPRFA